MQRRTVLAGVAVALAGCAADSGPQDDDSGNESSPESNGEQQQGSEPPDHETAEDRIRAHINVERAEAGVRELGRSRQLADAARAHSRDMYDREFYRHRNPDGQEPWDRVVCDAGENIHRGEIGRMQNADSEHRWQTRDPEELAGYVIEGWILSREHYENMVDPQWEQVGVGVHIDGGEFFVTAKFC